MDNIEKSKIHQNNDGIKIIVNGRSRIVEKKILTFIEIVELAFDKISDNTAYTITYSNHKADHPNGVLTKGDEIRINSEIIFNVSATNKS